MSQAPTLPGPILAALDLGTNSFHMVIVQIYTDPPYFTVLTRAKEMVRLGEVCPQTGRLTPIAMDRGLQALERFRELATSYAVQDITAVATSAVREAPNGLDFLQQIQRVTGIEVDLISGREEARRIYLGVLSAVNFNHQPQVIVDIGGGSTELILGDGAEPLFLSSTKVGAVRLTQDFISTDPISREDYTQLQHHIRLKLAPTITELQQNGSYVRLMATSGTAEALALLDAESPPTSWHGYILERGRLQALIQQLRPLSIAQRRKLPNLPERRADVILAGAMILLEVMTLLGIEQLTLCERALREGLVVEWMMEHHLIAGYARYQSAMREHSVRAMAQQYQQEWAHVSQVALFALSLFDQLQVLQVHSWPEETRHLLWAAAILHNVGHFVNHSAHHKHAYYLIRNGGLLGYTENEIDLIAQLARYHRNSPPKRRHETWTALSKEDRLLVSQLSALLRLATALDRRRQHIVASATLETVAEGLILRIKPVNPQEDCALELWDLETKKAIFEAEFHRKLQITCEVPHSQPQLSEI